MVQIYSWYFPHYNSGERMELFLSKYQKGAPDCYRGRVTEYIRMGMVIWYIIKT